VDVGLILRHFLRSKRAGIVKLLTLLPDP
jgi:hypothetical protein